MAVLSSFDPFAYEPDPEPESEFDDSDQGGVHGGVHGGDRGGAVGEVRSPLKVERPAPALAEIVERIRPTVLAAERTLPVPAAMRDLFPLGGVARGSRLCIRGAGASSLCMATLAEASREGSWIAVVGGESWGWAAAARAGWKLQRCIVVDEPPVSRWGTVVAALVDAFDLVVVDPTHQVSAADARRLVARSRERAAVLIDVAVPDGRRRFRWPTEAELTLQVDTTTWDGLGAGAGMLGRRQVTVSSVGRRGAARPRRVELSIAPDGALAVLEGAFETSVSASASASETSAAPANRRLRAAG
ncbi:MAG: hypothetical protein M9952_02905 [Microthrixaceae bacterium]|nr:hypothetical protein [Microthrixaceae bacterium]MCO5311866.1 hypothetical protein [Microthrixaceae bacterium]